MTLSTFGGLTLLATGQTQKETTINDAINGLSTMAAGRLTKNVAGSANVTLTAAESTYRNIKLTGTLTGSITVFLTVTNAEANSPVIVKNSTTGAFTVTIKTTAGGSLGAGVTQGQTAEFTHDGTDVTKLFESGVAGTGTVTSVASGTGLTGGPVTTSGTISLANTAVTAGSYTSANITVDAQGRITLAANGTTAFVGARVFHSAAQSLTSGVFTALAFDSERFDVTTLHDTVTNNSRITFASSGKYMLGGWIEYASNATGSRTLAVQISAGVARPVDIRLSPVSGDVTRIVGNSLYDITAGQYAELMGLQSSGGALNVSATEFWAYKVG